jgi:DNA-binding transcriptional MerR regulator
LFHRSRGAELPAWSTDNVLPFRAHGQPVQLHLAARHDDDAPGGSGGASRSALLGEEQLRAIETTHPGGLTAVQIVDAFTREGIKFSEASFRKYVQQGLLPRSRRVGRKGKHKGSLGVYPAKTVRRINDVKRLMAEGYTIEQIQGQFLLYTDLIEGAGEHLATLWSRLDGDLARFPAQDRTKLNKELTELRRDGERLVDRLGDLARRVGAQRTDTLRLAGAAGGAEDLL